MRYTLKSRNSKLVSALSIKRYIKKVKNYRDFLTEPGTDKAVVSAKKQSIVGRKTQKPINANKDSKRTVDSSRELMLVYRCHV